MLDGLKFYHIAKPKTPTINEVECKGRALEVFSRKTRNSFVREPEARTCSLPS